MCEKIKYVKVVEYSNGSKVITNYEFTSLPPMKKNNGGRKAKTDSGRLMTYVEHKTSLNRNLKTLFRLDYDEQKALFVTLKIASPTADNLTEYKAVEIQIKSLITAITRNKELNQQHGKILYVRGIERKANSYHAHCTFVFEKNKPSKESFKKKLKALWTFGDICIEPVRSKQGLAMYYTKMKNKFIDYDTDELYVPYYPSGAHIIEKSRGFKLLDFQTDFESTEQIKDEMSSKEFICYKKQHKYKGKMCIDTIYLIPKNTTEKK